MDKEGAVNMPCTPTNNPQRTLIAIHFRNQGGKMGFAAGGIEGRLITLEPSMLMDRIFY
jgi:hypothetical protein